MKSINFINPVPETVRRRVARWLVITALGTIILLIASGWVVKSFWQQYWKVRKEYSTSLAAHQESSTVQARIATLETELKVLKDKHDAVHNLNERSSHVIGLLTTVMQEIEGVIIGSCVVSQEGTVALTGQALTLNAVNDFIRILQESRLVKEPMLEQIAALEGKGNGVAVMNFNFVLKALLA